MFMFMFMVSNQMVCVFKLKKNNYSYKNRLFWINKRIFDIVMCILLLPLLFLISCILLIFNYFFNRGRLFFIQKRMGKDCIPFNALKFR